MLASVIRNMLVSCGFSEVFSFSPSALDCAEPIVVSQGAFARDARLSDGERGEVPVTVLIVREVSADAESIAGACERALRGADWERCAEDWPWRVVGIDTSAPTFRERDSSGRFVWGFDVTVTTVRTV